ncbi:secretory pathway protein Sec39-domain-containing protein [Halteromyces radiatus]|uniref:secretory pathway protein Sec39-domain-containing protein n=1 Tax=Halteromyces radiatus TaxID=101107 RepID=UPI00221E9B30|nr:secretory pathway protein Sec39-domain-containing protein [Halteromyces radiatus]KAI8086448.1 secretory pathway protein Sec39-domain-containing protein [Halteromyces radiatus]
MSDQSLHTDFLYHLTEKHYQAALDLGKELDIDSDIVYKTQWFSRLDELGSHFTKQDVDLLERIHDDAWVVSQCLDLVADNDTLQQRILQIGLNLTRKHTDDLLQSLQSQYEQQHLVSSTLSSPAAATTEAEAAAKGSVEQISVNDNDRLWIFARRYFLQYMDRLHTFVKIWPLVAQDTVMFTEAYSDFRDVNLVAQAIEFARSENNRALDVLFMHHGTTLLPYRLFILSQVPETVDPASFDLPHVTGSYEDLWVQEPWRQDSDLAELPWVESLILPQQKNNIINDNNNSKNDREDTENILTAAPEEANYLSQLHQVVETTPYPAPANIIAEWYLHRARTMDSLGLASHALGLVRYAKAMGVPDMDDHVERYDWLCKFIYASSTTDMDLAAFEHLSDYDVLEGLLLQTSTDTIVQDMRRLVLPWLERCTRKRQKDIMKDDDDDDDDERPVFLLYRWLLGQSSEQLHRCCVIFEASKPTLSMEERIIKDDCDLSRLVLALVYSSDGSMEYLVRMFECLPLFPDIDVEGNNNSDNEVDMATLLPLAGTPLGLFTALQSIQKAGLTKMMDTLQAHLMSAEVLARYHASVPLRWYLQDQSVDIQRQLCIRMASQAAGGVETGGVQFDRDDDWRELLDDMLRLHDDGNGIFGKIESTEIMEIFYSSLLRCGRFHLAKELVVGSRSLLGMEQAEKLVIDAEREFFDNSTNGNMNTSNMKKAWDCLHVLPPTANIKKEMDLIEATHTLISVYQVTSKPGLVLMPIQLRQSTDRLDFISRLVNTRKGIYRQFKEVVTLTQKLGYQGDLLAEVTVLSMMAGAAMVDEEYLSCYRLCQATVDKAQSITTSKQHNRNYVDKVRQAAWQICFNLGKLDAWHDTLRRLDVLAMALTVCPVEYMHDILTVYQRLEQQQSTLLFDNPLEIVKLEQSRYDNLEMEIQQRGTVGWQGLLESAKKRQWIIGDLLKAGGGLYSSSSQDRLLDPHLSTSSSTSSSSPSSNIITDDSFHPGGGKRKRDQLRDIVGGVGGWLFQQ